MKSILSILFFFVSLIIFSQNKQFVLIDVATNQNFIKKDSASAVKFLDSLSQNQYFFTRLKDVKKVGDITQIYFDKGKSINEVWVKIKDTLDKNSGREHQFFLTKNLDSLKKSINNRIADKGYTFNRLKSEYKGLKSGIPMVEISVLPAEKRIINGFVVKGYEKVPKRLVKNLNRDFVGKTYDEKNLNAIHQQIKNHLFVELQKPPQTLFTRDSTNIYLFLKKKKVNSFDGIIGFGNDKSEKISFNGNISLQFKNVFNSFETIGIDWQRGADKNQNFNLHTDFPYLFRSNIGSTLNMNIYRQDSTFANFKVAPSLYYNFNNRLKAGVNFNYETSTNSINTAEQLSNYNKEGIGFFTSYAIPSEIQLFINKTYLYTEAGYNQVKYLDHSITDNRIDYTVIAEHNLHLLGNHWLNVKGNMAGNNSKRMLMNNELLRFGGWNTMRGFNENSLLANFFAYTGAEYRYVIGEQAFFDAFGQFGWFENRLIHKKPKIYSLGLGFNYTLPIGIMSLQISNGNEVGNPFRFNTTKIHWGILSRF